MDFISSNSLGITPQENIGPNSTPVKLASWVQGPYLTWVRLYLAAKNNHLNRLNLNYSNAQDVLSRTVFDDPREATILESFLSREASETRLHALEFLAGHARPSEEGFISLPTNQGDFIIDRTCSLGMMASLLRDLTSSQKNIYQGNDKKIEKAVINFNRAVTELHEAVGEEVAPRLYGRNICPEVFDTINRSMLENAKTGILPRELDPVKNPALLAQMRFHNRSAADILKSYADGLVNFQKRGAIPLFQSNNGRPSLKLYRIKLVTYSLIQMTSIETLQKTKRLYSLIAYIVGLSINPQLESSQLMQPREVQKQVDDAIKLWQKYKPTTLDRRGHWKRRSHFN